MELKTGITFPDYELPDHTGVARRLSALQGRPYGSDPLPRFLLPQGPATVARFAGLLAAMCRRFRSARNNHDGFADGIK